MQSKLKGENPYIIAEVGSNWSSFEDAKDSIAKAAMAGANAVKFQLFDALSLYGPFVSNEELEKLQKITLPKIWIPKLKEKADACGIDFMCSAFSPELYEFLDPFVSAHKIASSELSYIPLLEKVKSFRKPIFLSVGASSKGDVKLALQTLEDGPRVILMYCVSAYPSHMYNLFQIEELKEIHEIHKDVGFSDHSIDLYPALSAHHHFDCQYIEKHVDFSNSKHSPDSPHSLSHDDFVYMMQILRGTRPLKEFNPAPEESEMFLRHNRRIFATADIKAGDRFSYPSNFSFFRSLVDDDKGIGGFAYDSLIKSNGAKVSIKAGDPIGPHDVDWAKH